MSPRLRTDIATTSTEHGTVLLDERTGRYWQLNNTGSGILHALLAGQSQEQIVADLAERHDLEPKRARSDVTAIIDRLCAAKLLVTS
ncbi:lasso peptide biosynthesis PqqD family chaperone [Streptomyces radicis]|uniref:Lasso peptide biosynthesis PqqD family chaperone n=1 Tax=Streptomyces radicis TaxID=1750517 RepID=A0A3A9W6A3_9ACTN|nr:lasso peptide biosynthesis PqqD family chaperone [Streptomyces radicis]RKN08390.1 lasso peptide biosynthesis PqqD family chaperone [Streptomyces radicis]RKN21576.1 lasso peptide biosynthesis PqqD family chaperone [Streptomyces radicis]